MFADYLYPSSFELIKHPHHGVTETLSKVFACVFIDSIFINLTWLVSMCFPHLFSSVLYVVVLCGVGGESLYSHPLEDNEELIRLEVSLILCSFSL